MHVLIIEDDIELGPALLGALKQQGISGMWVRRLHEALALDTEPMDAVLLDLCLPDGEGLDLLRRWRARCSDLPVIVITARSDLQDRLDGLDSGADDYLVKPFAIPELIARLWAVQRRYARQADALWKFGALTVDPKGSAAWLRGEPLALSAREFRLLFELVKDPGAVVSKSVLGQRLEPLGDPVDPSTIEVHMSNLRRKLGGQVIHTVRGIGYRWSGWEDGEPMAGAGVA